jgi:site-specific recombinase XerD
MDILTKLPQELREPTEAWLATKAEGTARGYSFNIDYWLHYCQAHGVNPYAPTQAQIDLYGGHLRSISATATVHRKLTALRSWFSYLLRCEVVKRNPFTTVELPRVDRHYSDTRFLSLEEAQLLIKAAEMYSIQNRLRNVALVRLMLILGIRVGEAVKLRIDALETRDGQRFILVKGKGSKRTHRALPPVVAQAIDDYLAARPHTGHLFVTSTGRRLDESYVFRLVQTIANAAHLAQPHTITPHSLRHTFATGAEELGASLNQTQEAMGHSSPDITSRYLHASKAWSSDPAHRLAEALG